MRRWSSFGAFQQARSGHDDRAVKRAAHRLLACAGCAGDDECVQLLLMGRYL